MQTFTFDLLPEKWSKGYCDFWNDKILAKELTHKKSHIDWTRYGVRSIDVVSVLRSGTAIGGSSIKIKYCLNLTNIIYNIIQLRNILIIS